MWPVRRWNHCLASRLALVAARLRRHVVVMRRETCFPQVIRKIRLVACCIFKMVSLQTFHIVHLPPDLAVHVALYTNVENASFLRDQLLQGNTDFEYALIDASTVCSRHTPRDENRR